MKVEERNIDLVFPYFNNPRNNNNAIKPTADSISRFGFVTPIMVDKNGTIICGHTRYFASVQLGLKQIPAICVDMAEEKAKKFRILDNKVCEKSLFNEEELIAELKAMNAPENMQSFFFEDINSMLNFNSRSIMSNFEYEDDDTDSELQLSETTNSNENQDTVENESNSDLEEDDEKASERSLYKPYIRDGKTFMRVLCPYCEKIEEIEII